MKISSKLKTGTLLLILILFSLLAVVIIPATAQTSKPIELRFGYDSPPNSESARVYEAWASKVEEATNGRVKIIHYPANSLFKSTDTLHAIESGITDIGRTSIANFPGMFPLTEVTVMPFLSARSSGTLPSHILNTMVVNDMFETIPEIQEEMSRYKVLYIAGQENYWIATTKKPIHTLEDLKGLKIRVGGVFGTQIIEDMGATPVGIPYVDVYDAAMKGVIDGATTIADMISPFLLHQVLPYWSDTGLWYSTVLLLMNKETWESIPEDIQEQIMSVSGREFALWQADELFGEKAQKKNEELMKKDGKMVTFYTIKDSDEIKKFEEMGKKSWEKWVKIMEDKGLPGRKILDQVLEIYAKY